MVDLRIRRLDDWVARRLPPPRAKRNGHSLEEELRQALRQDVKREKEQLVAEATWRCSRRCVISTAPSPTAHFSFVKIGTRADDCCGRQCGRQMVPFPKPAPEQALALIDGAIPLAAPSLIRLEVHGAITRRHRLSELREEEATVLCGKWAQRLKQGVVTLVPESDILDRAIALAPETASRASRLPVPGRGRTPVRSLGHGRSDLPETSGQALPPDASSHPLESQLRPTC